MSTPDQRYPREPVPPYPPREPAPPYRPYPPRPDQPPHPGSGYPSPVPPGSQSPQHPQGPPSAQAGPYGGGREGDPGRDAGRRRRRPTWPALVATALGSALLASAATVGLERASDASPVAATRVAESGAPEPRREAAGPVVTSTTDDPDWANLAATVGPSVVAIDVRTAAGAGQGSGVIIDADGLVVTNHHVAGGARGGAGQIRVTLADGRMFEAEVVGTDEATDLAVIRLDDPPDDLQAAPLGDSEEVVVGDPVAAIGNPLGLSNTVTTGIVSALDRPTTTQQQGAGRSPVFATTNAIQVDAPINPGNSGGPLFDAVGRVIGINSSIASIPNAGGQAGSIGLGFAIPSNLVRLIVDQLIEDGTAEHAYLGVVPVNAMVEVDGQNRAGAGVEGVQPDTPAEQAGLRPGDVVIAIDGKPVSGAESLIGFVRQYPSGEEVTVTVARDGEAQEVTVALATRPDEL